MRLTLTLAGLLLVVQAHAQPAAPIGAIPAPPATSQTDSGIFTASAPTCSQVTSRGLPSDWLKVL